MRITKASGLLHLLGIDFGSQSFGLYVPCHLIQIELTMASGIWLTIPAIIEVSLKLAQQIYRATSDAMSGGSLAKIPVDYLSMT
jgi:hypothetical protein